MDAIHFYKCKKFLMFTFGNDIYMIVRKRDGLRSLADVSGCDLNLYVHLTEGKLVEGCFSMALLGPLQVLTVLNFWASRQNGFRNGYQKPPAEQTR